MYIYFNSANFMTRGNKSPYNLLLIIKEAKLGSYNAVIINIFNIKNNND